VIKWKDDVIFFFWVDLSYVIKVSNNNNWKMEYCRGNVKIRFGKWFYEVRVVRSGKAEVGWCTSKFKRVCLMFFVYLFYFVFEWCFVKTHLIFWFRVVKREHFWPQVKARKLRVRTQRIMGRLAEWRFYRMLSEPWRMCGQRYLIWAQTVKTLRNKKSQKIKEKEGKTV